MITETGAEVKVFGGNWPSGYDDGLTGEVHAGYAGWTVSVQRDQRGESYLVRKTWRFF